MEKPANDRSLLNPSEDSTQKYYGCHPLKETLEVLHTDNFKVRPTLLVFDNGIAIPPLLIVTQGEILTRVQTRHIPKPSWRLCYSVPGKSHQT
jgi:hypothetical protein